MNKSNMQLFIETDRLVMFPYTEENLHLFNTDLSAFEREYGVVYRGEELDRLLSEYLIKLEAEIAADRKNYLFFTEFLIVLKENDRVIMLGLISDISSIEKLLKDNRKLHLLFGR